MLGRRFIKINNEAIPNPVDGFGYDFTPDETISLSEAGTELVRVRRLDKRVFKGTWHLTSFWKDKFEEWAQQSAVSLYFEGHTYQVRMRDYNPQLVPNSEWVSTSEGLWIISPTFTEI